MSKIKLGKNAIMFGSSDCIACLTQIKMLLNYFGKKDINIEYYDLKLYEPPMFILDKNGYYSAPTLWIPTRGGYGKLHSGIITDKKMFVKLIKKNNTSFGKCGSTDYSIPEIDTLIECGKNFPNKEGMQIPNSFQKNIESVWGTGSDALNSGIGGTRSLGPDNITDMYSNNYVNNIRMAVPGGQLDTALRLNRECNYSNNKVPQFNTPGMIYNSVNPQIVGFGKRKKSNFGNLYNQMGPAYGSQYLMNMDTVKYLNGGGINNNNPRPSTIINPYSYIGISPMYQPVKSQWNNDNQFGKKKKKIGEGSVLSIKNNKVKVKS